MLEGANTMKITKEQLNNIEYVLALAEYFVQDQDPSSDCRAGDIDNLVRAQQTIAAIRLTQGE